MDIISPELRAQVEGLKNLEETREFVKVPEGEHLTKDNGSERLLALAGHGKFFDAFLLRRLASEKIETTKALLLNPALNARQWEFVMDIIIDIERPQLVEIFKLVCRVGTQHLITKEQINKAYKWASGPTNATTTPKTPLKELLDILTDNYLGGSPPAKDRERIVAYLKKR